MFFSTINIVPFPLNSVTDKYLQYFLKDFIYLFLEKGEGREKEGGRETSVCGCLSHAPLLGTRPATQARALPGD